jgi:hypothetical protein
MKYVAAAGARGQTLRTFRRAYPAANDSSRIFEAGKNRLDGLAAFDSMSDSLISEWDGNPSYPLSTGCYRTSPKFSPPTSSVRDCR